MCRGSNGLALFIKRKVVISIGEPKAGVLTSRCSSFSWGGSVLGVCIARCCAVITGLFLTFPRSQAAEVGPSQEGMLLWGCLGGFSFTQARGLDLRLPREEDRVPSIRETGSEPAEGPSAQGERCQEGRRGAAAGQHVQTQPPSCARPGHPSSSTQMKLRGEASLLKWLFTHLYNNLLTAHSSGRQTFGEMQVCACSGSTLWF